MKSVEFLFEYRRDVTAQKLGDKLLASAKRENITDIDKILAAIEDMDPTPNKQYTLWIANQYNKGQFRLEDKPRIKTALERFIQAKSRLQEKDIGRYDFHQLEDAMEKIFNPDVGKQEIQTTDTFEIPNEIKDKVEVLYNGPLGLLTVPKSKKASCILGSSTRWCTAATDYNYFSIYNRSGPLYIWRDKNGEKYQFHFPSNQYMDKQDRSISKELMRYFSNEHPILKKLFDLRLNQMLEKKTPASRIITFSLNTLKILPEEIQDKLLKNISNAIDYAEKLNIKKWPNLEKLLISKLNPELIYPYARHVIKGRWLEGEEIIAKSPTYAYEYAKHVIKGRWPEGEEIIAKSPYYAYHYARHVIKGRWPEGEKAIAKDGEYAYEYARNIIKGRWPEGESEIAKDPVLAIMYAANIIKGRFPEAEDYILNSYNQEHPLDYAVRIKRKFPKGEEVFARNARSAYLYALISLRKRRFKQGESMIAKSPTYAYEYAKHVIKGRWPEGERIIAKSPMYAYEYARNIIKGRWPEGERIIAKSPMYAYYYAKDIIKGRWPEGEKAIAKDGEYAYEYAINIIKSRWPEGEKAILYSTHIRHQYENFLASLKKKKKKSTGTTR
jgi:lambda repressor-like predicted transcriptional regulator